MSMKDLILNQSDRKTIQLEVPEWTDSNGKPLTIYLREFSAKERDADAAEAIKADREGKGLPDNWRTKFIVRSIVDSEGNRVFADSDVPALSLKNAKAIDRIFEAVSD